MVPASATLLRRSDADPVSPPATPAIWQTHVLPPQVPRYAPSKELHTQSPQRSACLPSPLGIPQIPLAVRIVLSAFHRRPVRRYWLAGPRRNYVWDLLHALV